jgi:hypothetical protein
MWCENVEWICVAHDRCPVFDRFSFQFSAHRRDILGFLVVSLCPLSAHVCILPRTSPGPLPSAFPKTWGVCIFLLAAMFPLVLHWLNLKRFWWKQIREISVAAPLQVLVMLYFYTPCRRVVEWKCMPHFLNRGYRWKRAVALILRPLYSQGQRPLHTLHVRQGGPWLGPGWTLAGPQSGFERCEEEVKLLWEVAQRRLAVIYRLLGQPVGPETSVTSHVLCVTSLKSQELV